MSRREVALCSSQDTVTSQRVGSDVVTLDAWLVGLLSRCDVSCTFSIFLLLASNYSSHNFI